MRQSFHRTLRTMLHLARQPVSPRTRRIAMVVAFGLFAGLATTSWLVFPWDEVDERPIFFLVIAGIGVPLNLWLNVAEFGVQQRAVGLTPHWRRDTEVVIAARAANLLPLPGSVLVRTASLTQRGCSATTASLSTLLVALTWMASTFLLAGAALGSLGIHAASALSTGVGLLLLVAAAAVLRRDAFERPHKWRLFATLLVIELAGSVVAGGRFWLAALALGIDAELAQLLPLATAGALASAVGFFPAGLGLREALAGLAAGIGNLPVSTGVLVATADRIVALVVVAVLSIALSTRAPARPSTTGSSDLESRRVPS